MRRILCGALALFLILCASGAGIGEEAEEKQLRILFTHDIHSYFDVTNAVVDGVVRERGGAARLKTLLMENRDENTVYLDAGDFSMGTLLQAGFRTDAYELRLLGLLGCDVTTFGNHEFDFGGTGVADMLRSAVSSGDPLPKLVQSNMIMTGELTDEQQTLTDAMEEYGASRSVILDVNGLRVGVFGLLGENGIEDAPTSGMNFIANAEAAKNAVSTLREEGADVIVCLSHSGTEGDGQNGEDIDLAKAVPEIDVIVSGHSHSAYREPVTVGSTILVSAGEYLNNLGEINLSVKDGQVTCQDYRLIPVDASVEEDAEMAEICAEIKKNIEEGYLAREGCSFDQVVAHSDFSFMPLGEMYSTHQEYPMGNLIADAYQYEARRNGVDDIDVALVGLGTVRGSFLQGDITVSDVFEICSLGMGEDGSAGHPILACYVTGAELKLLVELDASLGPLVSSIKMSYSGLRYTFNTRRVLLDRATDIRLVRPDGTWEKIEDDKLYKAACNMYAANMLGMVNGLTRGILSIVPKDADGQPVEDLYACALHNTEGREIKEWVALKNYLSSFPKKNGVPTIPRSYASQEGRKEKISVGGQEALRNPGLTTILVIALPPVLLAVIGILFVTRKKRKAKRLMRRQMRKERRMRKTEGA